MSGRLFDAKIRPHIYAIYGLVRIADEIVDTYMGTDTREQLDALETHVLEQLKSKQPFSPNPIVQSFVVTAQRFNFGSELIKPFFKSMRTDITAKSFSKKSYDEYIYGSAEVIGLMCVKVFANDNTLYNNLKPGALALGRAYQKVNFLRDMRSDFYERGRVYFPGVSFESFNDTVKKEIEADIEKDFREAAASIQAIPRSARAAISTSYDYYWQLFIRLKRASATDIKTRRLRVPNTIKIAIFSKAKLVRQ